MPHASINGLNLYYEIEGTGHPLVLIAGYTANLKLWQLVREELSRHFQLILFDNRGAGKTEFPDAPFTVEQMGEDTVQLIKHLDLVKPHILGHSMGGAIAQSIGFHHAKEVGKTIFAHTLLNLPSLNKLALLGVLHLREDGVSLLRQAEVAMPWIFSNDFLSSREKCEKFLEAQKEYGLTLKGQKRQYEALSHFDSRKWVQRIATPSLVIWGDEDRLTPASESELIAQSIPHSKSYIFRNMGHMSLIEKPQEFCQVVVPFLKSPSI